MLFEIELEFERKAIPSLKIELMIDLEFNIKIDLEFNIKIDLKQSRNIHTRYKLSTIRGRPERRICELYVIIIF